MGGAQIVEGVTVTGFVTAGGRVTGVETDHGSIETETVVIAAGMWGRQLGALAGVTVPLQAAEHYYLLTDTVEWAHPDLPVVEDPDRYGYYREEAGGILVGLFEPKAAPWSLDRIPQDLGFAVLPPDWDRMAGFLSDAMDRFPSLHDAGIRQFFCGPESFTPDIGPLLGEAPELRGFFTACGLNSLGILLSGGVGSFMTQWILDGEPPMDVTGMSVDRTMPFMTNRAFRAERGVELLGALFGDSAFPSWRPWSAPRRAALGGARPVGRCGRGLHGAVGLRGAGVVRRSGCVARATAGLGARSVVRGAGERAPRRARGGRRDGHVVHGEDPRAGPGRRGPAQPRERVQRLGADRQDRVHPVADRARRHLDRRHGHAPAGGRLPRRRRRHHPPTHALVAAPARRRWPLRRDHRHLIGAHAPDGARAALARAAVAAHHGGPVQRSRSPICAPRRSRSATGVALALAGDLPGRARLGAAHPDRLRVDGVRRPVRGGSETSASATPGSARSTPCGWRRATGTTGSTSTTPIR